MNESIEQNRNPDRHIRCPKCKGKVLELFEYIQTTNIYLQNKNYLVTKKEDKDSTSAQATQVNAHCAECQHEWRVRGVKSLDYFRYTQNKKEI